MTWALLSMPLVNRSIQRVLAFFVLSVLICPTAMAIGFGFSVYDNSGGVSLTDYYLASDDVSVYESGAGGYYPASISSTRTISGSGSIKMAQVYKGSGGSGGSGYSGYNNLYARNSSKMEAETAASLTPSTLDVDQSASFRNTELVKFCLGACRGTESVRQFGWLYSGNLSMDQTLDVNAAGLSTGINAEMDGKKGMVKSRAVDSLGSSAQTEVGFTQGNLTTTQAARVFSDPENIMAMASQSSELWALSAYARTSAESYTGNRAGVTVKLLDGKMRTDQIARANDTAIASAATHIWDANGASTTTYASNADGDLVYSKVNATMQRGTFDSLQTAKANGSLDLYNDAQGTRVTSVTSLALALIKNKYLAKTSSYADMNLGNFSTSMWANVNKTFERAQSYQSIVQQKRSMHPQESLAWSFMATDPGHMPMPQWIMAHLPQSCMARRMARAHWQCN